ncbi:CDP-diacylglycerol--glycerol-3-phosphate 3-phosphatidyltransferase [Candidatus Woesearchaeota archaeon]|nr:CDP-diacylglycerol--glycerol-3-phosphate 3-phosphatidyltransferase [Candidatus Woesearchaeota archaeon]
MNIANLITIGRIALLPIIIYFIYRESLLFSFIAIVLFSVTVLSDYFDGLVARKRGEVTDVGSFLDPLSDKIVVIGLLLVFLVRGTFWLLPIAIFIFRDFAINGVRSMAAKHDVVIAADMYGKLKTNAQFILIYLLMIKDFLIYDLLQNTFWMDIVNIVIIVFTVLAVVLSLFSMANYCYQYIIKRREVKSSGKKVEKENMIILANRRSRGYHDRYRRRLLRRFAKRRQARILYLPNSKDMFAGIDKVVKRYDHIIIAGGDGSFEGALNYKPFNGKSIGFFPLGAGNAFYSYFYRGKKFEYLRSRFKFKEEKLDVVEIEWEKGKQVTLFAGLGIDAEVARLGKTRTQNGFLDYISASWNALLKSKADYDLSVSIDGTKQFWENCVALAFGKVPYYGYAIRAMVGPIKPHDGNVYGLGVVNRHSAWLNKPLRAWGLVLASLGIVRPPLVYVRGKKIVLTSDVPFPIQAGGEFLGYTTFLKMKVVRKQNVLKI